MSVLPESHDVCPLCGRAGRFQIAQPDKYLGLRPDISHPYYSCASCCHLFQPIIDTDLLLSFYPASYYQEGGSSTALLLRSRGCTHPLLGAAVALGVAAFLAVPRIFGRNSVMYAYARKQ